MEKAYANPSYNELSYDDVLHNEFRPDVSVSPAVNVTPSKRGKPKRLTI
jgi:hypothetical protein